VKVGKVNYNPWFLLSKCPTLYLCFVVFVKFIEDVLEHKESDQLLA
jgi:hypothetical protein